MKKVNLRIGNIVKINGQDQAIIGFLGGFVLTLDTNYDRSSIYIDDIYSCEKSYVKMNQDLITNFIKLNDLQDQIQSLEADTFKAKDILISA